MIISYELPSHQDKKVKIGAWDPLPVVLCLFVGSKVFFILFIHWVHDHLKFITNATLYNVLTSMIILLSAVVVGCHEGLLRGWLSVETESATVRIYLFWRVKAVFIHHDQQVRYYWFSAPSVCCCCVFITILLNWCPCSIYHSSRYPPAKGWIIVMGIFFILWCIGWELNHNHQDQFNSLFRVSWSKKFWYWSITHSLLPPETYFNSSHPAAPTDRY